MPLDTISTAVAPHAGAWIETSLLSVARPARTGRPSRGGVDRPEPRSAPVGPRQTRVGREPPLRVAQIRHEDRRLGAPSPIADAAGIARLISAAPELVKKTLAA
ncbi:hypothetical protein DDV93_19305 [Cereibacter johrii]|nr:hypothetical protein DDV93_19305 [Cereibacter johrii]